MEKYKIKIEITGARASLFLLDKKRHAVDELKWIDKRDLAEKILLKINLLLEKNAISLKNISRFIFNCDSPYYKKNNKRKSAFSLTNESSKSKCGFTSWQMGEITVKTLNYCLGSERKSR